MSDIFKKENIFETSVLAFGLYPIVPDKLKGILVAFLLLTSLLDFFNQKGDRKLDYRTFFVNVSFYIMAVISLVYTSNFSRAIKMLTETQLSALIIPLAFLFHSSNNSSINDLFKKFKNTFIKATAIFSLFYVFYLFVKPKSDNPFFEFPSVFFFRDGMTEMPLIGIEPIYGSIYLSIAIILIFNELIKTRTVNYFKAICLVGFFVITILLSSKMALLSIFIISIYLLLNTIKINTKQKILAGLILIVGLIGLFRVPTINQRSKEFFKKETYTEYKRHNSTSIRLTILRSGIKLVKDNMLTGVGIGDVKDELVKSYENISYDLVERRYNTHNQYLSVFVGTGLFGFAAFIFLLLYNLKISINKENQELLLLIVLFMLNFLTENILERQNGVMFFFFIIGLSSFKMHYKLGQD